MGRDFTSIVKQSRREGYALHPKAYKYLIKKSYIPGQHGGSRRRMGRRSPSQYGLQLREKQKIKRLYGLLEKQFANLFKKASRLSGKTGENTLMLLERRLDNAIYRVGFASSRRAARQLVSHKHFTVNNQRVNIASICLKPDDEVKIYPKSLKNAYFKNINDLSPPPGQIPAWLTVDRAKISFTVNQMPNRDDITDEINEQLMVEYYSR